MAFESEYDLKMSSKSYLYGKISTDEKGADHSILVTSEEKDAFKMQAKFDSNYAYVQFPAGHPLTLVQNKYNHKTNELMPPNAECTALGHVKKCLDDKPKSFVACTNETVTFR